MERETLQGEGNIERVEAGAGRRESLHELKEDGYD